MMMILITRFEFTARASLWSPISCDEYIPEAKFGVITRMARQWFGDVWSELQ